MNATSTPRSPSASARADSAPRRFRCGSLLPVADSAHKYPIGYFLRQGCRRALVRWECKLQRQNATSPAPQNAVGVAAGPPHLALCGCCCDVASHPHRPLGGQLAKQKGLNRKSHTMVALYSTGRLHHNEVGEAVDAQLHALQCPSSPRRLRSVGTVYSYVRPIEISAAVVSHV
eukprot:COSAG01_NODE_2939_length_6824_cov_6.394349_9_plen_174_part_00